MDGEHEQSTKEKNMYKMENQEHDLKTWLHYLMWYEYFLHD